MRWPSIKAGGSAENESPSSTISATLRVALLPHHTSPIAGAAGDTHGMLQLGCSFVDLDAAAGRALQVYVDQTQKRRRLLKLDT